MKFLVDAGHEAAHVEDADLRDAEDSEIWMHALESGAVIMTKDEDFAARSTQAATAPVIVWLRVGNATNPLLRVWIEARLPGIVQLLNAEKRLIEVV